MNDGRGRRSLLLGAAFFLVAGLCRVNNLGTAFQGGVAQIRPLDELYHGKRIIHSATHFPSILEFDPDRGPAGSFCPWPPLYDLAAGCAARILGSRTEISVLNRAVWFPPVVGSLLAAIVAMVMARRLGRTAGMIAGTFIAFSPSLVNASQIGSIDHHFLEPALLLGLMGSVMLLVRAGRSRAVLRSAALVAAALVACLFVQVALILAAAVAVLAILLAGGDDARVHAAAGAAFATSAAVVIAYRLTRPPLYPDDQWHLGYPHFAALLGAAVTCALMAWITRRAGSPIVAILFSVLGGSAAAAAVPGTLDAFSSGSGFFGGDPWFSTIVEFRPLFFDPYGGVWDDLRLVGGATFLLVPMAVLGLRRPDKSRLVVSVFALVYLLAAISTKRFVIPLAGPLAIIAGVCVADVLAAGRKRLAAAVAVLAVGPSLYGCVRLLSNPVPVLTPGAGAMFRAADRIRKIDGGRHERILCQWDWGHLFSFTTGSPVISDGFGTMGGLTNFQEAQSAFFLVREEALASYCRRKGIRFVVLDNPFLRLPTSAQCFGVDTYHYLRPSPGGQGTYSITRLMQATFSWRAYFDHGLARPERGNWGSPFRFFRLVYSDPQASWGPPPFRGPMVQVWELTN